MSGALIAATAVLVFGAFGAEREGATSKPAGRGSWIVSPRSYWRYHYAFRPAQSFRPSESRLSFLPTRYGAKGTVPAANYLTTPDAPDDWAAPNFDDSAWPVARAPLPWVPEMDQDGEGPYSCHIIRVVSARTRFTVPDPSKVARLALDIRYHGGVIAYVNGREVGRGHIPADGPLAAERFAEMYPEEAYRPVGRQGTSPGGRNRMVTRGWWSLGGPFQRWRLRTPEERVLYDRLETVRVRRLRVEVPRDALRRGINVLAIENRLSPVLEFEFRGRKAYPYNFNRMPHIGIRDIALSEEPAGAVRSADLRPTGTHAWSQDVHQWTLEEDFLEPGVRERRDVRLLAPRNGACSAQVIVGTSRELADPSVAVSRLVGPNDVTIPPSAVRVRWARSLSMRRLRRMELATTHPSFRVSMQDRYFVRYRGSPPNTWVVQWGGTRDMQRALDRSRAGPDMRIFDPLSGRPPTKIAADTSQPLWLTVEVPRDAAPGGYTGVLTVRAKGMPDATFRVRLQVFDFALPDARRFTAYAGIDESPWSLAKWHKVGLWSEEHWKLVEQSVRLAGRLGARVVGIPVIHNTELDNVGDAMVKWVKRPRGGYDFDFTIADRYLDLWRRYGHVRSDVIVYLVLPADGYGRGGGTGAVTLVDPTGGTESAFTPPRPDTEEGKRLWLACAKAVRDHLNQRGVKDENLHWGLFYDYIGDAGFALAGPLAKAVPSVGWARSSHQGRKIHGGHPVTVTWNAAVRAEHKPPFAKDGTVTPLEGWRNPKGRLLLPRADSDVSALSVFPPLWQLREVQEMPITSAHRGFARICVDGWGRGSYFGPFNSYLTYPGVEPGTVDASIQFEILREGLQETEARIFLEQQESLSPTAKRVLDLRTQRIWAIPPRPEAQRIAEYYAGWQEMSWDLYAAAARAAGGKVPAAEARAAFFGRPAAEN